MSPQSRFRNLALRLALSLLTAAIISATAYLCAWLSYGGYRYLRIEQDMTRMTLDHLSEELAKHQQQTGQLPARLEDLDVVKRGGVPVDETGRPQDGWGRPLSYQVHEGSFELNSLGQDGQPGGVGLDADLYADRPGPVNEFLTLWQFTMDANTAGIQLSCLLAGLLAFPLCLLGTAGGELNRRSLVRALVVHGVTAAFAIVTAVVISVLHLPSGH